MAVPDGTATSDVVHHRKQEEQRHGQRDDASDEGADSQHAAEHRYTPLSVARQWTISTGSGLADADAHR